MTRARTNRSVIENVPLAVEDYITLYLFQIDSYTQMDV